VRLLVGAESDEDLERARKDAQAVVEIPDEDVLALARGDDLPLAGGPLRHARKGDFLDSLRA
jgi:hypothetical protein